MPLRCRPRHARPCRQGPERNAKCGEDQRVGLAELGPVGNAPGQCKAPGERRSSPCRAPTAGERHKCGKECKFVEDPPDDEARTQVDPGSPCHGDEEGGRVEVGMHSAAGAISTCQLIEQGFVVGVVSVCRRDGGIVVGSVVPPCGIGGRALARGGLERPGCARRGRRPPRTCQTVGAWQSRQTWILVARRLLAR